MKKLILGATIALLFTGCNWTKVENTWSTGKTVGSKYLPQNTKDKLAPLVEATETVYEDIKQKKNAK